MALDGKVAIVTGGSGGIGRGIALKLAAEGATVVICGRDAAKGEAAAKALAQSERGEVSFQAADALSWDDMRALAAGTAARYGRIDILVASGGGSHYPLPEEEGRAIGFFERIVPADAVEVIAKAALAKITPARAVADHMIAARSGSILFITSEGGRFPTPGQAPVAFHAGGLIAMSKVVAKELARYKVRVNTIAVSIVEDTPSWDLNFGEGAGALPAYEKIRARAPFGLAQPADIAEVAAFLASDSAQFLTGAVLSPTGGLTFS